MPRPTHPRMHCTWRQCVTLFTEELPWLRGADLELVMGRAFCDWIGWQPSELRVRGARRRLAARIGSGDFGACFLASPTTRKRAPMFARLPDGNCCPPRRRRVTGLTPRRERAADGP